MLIMRLKVDGDDISGELEMTRPRPFKGPVTGKRSGRNCQLQTRLTDGSLMQLNGNCWSEGFNGSLLVRFDDDRMPQKGHFNSGRLGAGQREEDD